MFMVWSRDQLSQFVMNYITEKKKKGLGLVCKELISP